MNISRQTLANTGTAVVGAVVGGAAIVAGVVGTGAIIRMTGTMAGAVGAAGPAIIYCGITNLAAAALSNAPNQTSTIECSARIINQAIPYGILLTKCLMAAELAKVAALVAPGWVKNTVNQVTRCFNR